MNWIPKALFCWAAAIVLCIAAVLLDDIIPVLLQATLYAESLALLLWGFHVMWIAEEVN